ncbi:MAG: response regulator, partial [Holophagales bacterium]|nr:response regulator [Holophagales bacterium]
SGINSAYDSFVGILFLLILPLWPFSYLYAVYKHGAGKAEFRANRLLGSYGFLSAYATGFVSLYILIGRWFETQRQQLLFSLTLTMTFVLLAPIVQRRFKLSVDRLIYGIRYQPEEVVSLFAARIPTAFDRKVLARVVLDEILPTMLIRQSALYLDHDDGHLGVVYEQDVPDPSPSLEEVRKLRAQVKPFRSLNLTGHERFSWVRLVIPLDTQDQEVGLWLFGRRDPDDYYPRTDIELLGNLGNQVAPVIENVRLVELAREEVEENRRLHDQLLQSQKMEAIGRLSAGVAHDFNNLLSVILGYSSLLLAKHPNDESLAKYLGDIKDAGDRAAILTKQLLAFSRQQVMEPRVMNLNTIIHDLGKMLRRITGEDLDLVIDLAENLPQVKIDPAQMGQVVMNLAVNARDAMPEGGRLEISTERLDLEYPVPDRQLGEIPAGSYALMTVADTGTGVEPAVLSRIFEPYFTTKDMGKGTGLGLSMVYGIVDQSKGFIRVESRLGEGTTFRVFLPESRDAEIAEDREIPRRASSSSRGSETILVVEDEDSVRQVACEILESNGYHVLQACNGVEALKDFEGHSGTIDLLLTDVVMPHMKGTVLAEQMSLNRPDLKIMYMSGYNEERLLGRRLGESGSSLIQKPFSPQGLARRVREVLDAPASTA